MRIFNGAIAGLSSAALMIAGGGLAHASTPADISDLVNARASSGETQLESRGYSFHHASQGDDRSWTYWWNRSSKTCVSVLTEDGRYSSIKKVTNADCGQKTGGGSDTGVAVAVGAAALIGAIALAHKSHDHDDGRHYDDSRREADFERGYRDGLYNNSYHNYSRSDPYSSGYSGGTGRRGHESPHRGGSDWNGGYDAYAGYTDIVGRNNDTADDMLRDRGFAYFGKDDARGTGHERTYWNARTRQCISVRTRGGSVSDVQSIKARNCR